jgi:hypothetical protein
MGQSPPLSASRLGRILAVLAGIAIATGCGPEGPKLSGGPHDGVTCAQCHGETKTADAVGPMPEGACGDCHDEELSSDVELAGIRFPHSPHASFLGGDTPCSACHTHAGGDQDLSIDESSCYLCHAEKPGPDDATRPAHLAEESCLECHGQPTHVAFAGTGAPVDHGVVVERGIACLQCHFDLIEGDGAVGVRTCGTCHATGGISVPLRADVPHEAATVHEQHFENGTRPACSRCHDAIDHHVGSISNVLGLDCRGCHAETDPALTAPLDPTAHQAELLLYTGLTAESDAVAPATKFTARIECVECHSPESMEHPGGSPERLDALEAECGACHGPGHGALLDGWVDTMRGRVETVGAYLDAAEADSRIRGRDRADSAAVAARRAWEVVEAGGGVHNIAAAHRLLELALASAETAYRRAGLSPPAPPPLGPDPNVQTCARCHYGVEAVRSAARGPVFDHGVHLMDAGLACDECHASAAFASGPDHGRVEVSPADCRGCHHRDAGGADRSCSGCHATEGLESAHARPVDAHRRCDACHDRTVVAGLVPGAGLCRLCHDPGQDHYAASGFECTECHFLATSAEYRSELSGGGDR